VVAEAEVALASRELTSSSKALESACRTLEARGDRWNAMHGRLVRIRGMLLVGRIDSAEALLAELDLSSAPPMLASIGELASAELSLRRMQVRAARSSLDRALIAAQRAGIAALASEIERSIASLEMPAARLRARGRERAIAIEEVDRVLSSDALVVDALRRAVRHRGDVVKLARRPVLFQLMSALASAWPRDVARDELARNIFEVKRTNESHRARMRVEIGRLRKEVRAMGQIEATQDGFALRTELEVVVLSPPIDGDHAAVLALLADGESWSTSALSLALGASQRSVQRALSSLEESGKVRSLGRARARRWLGEPLIGFTATLLLPAPAIG
jgi:hypothetical protein